MCAIMGFSRPGGGKRSWPVWTGPPAGPTWPSGGNRLRLAGLSPSVHYGAGRGGDAALRPGADQVVCNGELYGWRRSAQSWSRGATPSAASDCELLLPMYREYGLDMFARLDAEFAMIIYDGEADESLPPGTPSASVPSSMAICRRRHPLRQRGQEPGGPV